MIHLNLKKIKKFFDQLEKCQTAFQAGLFYAIFRFFPEARVEQAFWDPENNKHWRVDIVIGPIWVELDGLHHRFDDRRFRQDEMKDTFAFRSGKYVFRRSNEWWNQNWRKFPEILLEFVYLNKRVLFWLDD